MPTGFLSRLKLPAVSQNIQVLGVWKMEGPSQQGFWKLQAIALSLIERVEKNGQSYPNSRSADSGWKYVLLVPSSGQSLAEL